VVPCFHIAHMLRLPKFRYYLDLARTDNFFKRETLEGLGIRCGNVVQPESFPCGTPCFTCDDIVDAQYHPVVSADCVVFIRKTRYSWWARDFVRGSFMNLAKPRRKNRRLYFSRSEEERRRILNEDEVIALLRRYDFEVIQRGDFYVPYAEQISMFQEANIVITQRASIFFNLWYCKESFKLIVLWQKDENKYPGIIKKFRNVMDIDCEPISSAQFPDDRNCDNIIVNVRELEKAVVESLSLG
jgi:hypothetical protein